MEWEEIKAANKEIKTTPIKDKQYAEVPERVKAFRSLEPNGCISTEIIRLDAGVVVMKATVTNAKGEILATGTAYEKEGSTFINKDSYIENCETSAIGRALGFIGFGIDTSIASFEEVSNAIIQQEKASKTEPSKPTSNRPATDKQKAYIKKISPDMDVENLTVTEASEIIANYRKE